MGHEWFEIPVAVQQPMTAFDTARSNHGIGGVANGNAERAQSAKVPGRFNCDFLSPQVDHWQRRQRLSRLIEVAVAPESL